MSRAFDRQPVPLELLDHVVDLATRAPSAGKTQGWHFVVLEGDQVEAFWNDTLPPDRRASFTWPDLLAAPTIVLPLADPQMYVDRYSEPDKSRTGLGVGTDAWPVPYWTVDTSFAVMTLLLACTDVGLGALFFAVFAGEAELRSRLGIPERLQLVGAIAVGYPTGSEPRGRSASRSRRSTDSVVHRGRWHS
jgi:nitroreductase